MVVARPLGTSIPVGPVSEQNPALIANWVSVNLLEAFVFLGESGGGAPRFARRDSRGVCPYVVHLQSCFIKETVH
jgi:hypothetical protein